jgi:hypothetical protein
MTKQNDPRIQLLLDEIKHLRAERDGWKEQAADWKKVADSLVDEKLAGWRTMGRRRTRAKVPARMRYYEIGAFCTATLEAIANGTAVEKDEAGRKWRCQADVIFNAARHFGVSKRTVEKGLEIYRAIRPKDAAVIETASIIEALAGDDERNRVFLR